MSNVKTGILITDSHFNTFSNVTCEGVDTAVKVKNSTNITFNEIKHIKPRQLTVLYVSIIEVLYSIKF